MTQRLRIQGRRRDIAAACVTLDQLLVYVGRCHPCLWPIARKTRHVLLSLFFGMKEGVTVTMDGDADAWDEDPSGLVPVPKLAAGDEARLRRALGAYGERKSWYELAQNMQKKLGIMRDNFAEAEEQQGKLMQVMDRAVRYWQGVVRGVILRGWRAVFRMHKEVSKAASQTQAAYEKMLSHARERWDASAAEQRREWEEQALQQWRLKECELEKRADTAKAELATRTEELAALREELQQQKEHIASLDEEIAKHKAAIADHEREAQRYQALCREFIQVSLEGPTWTVIKQEEMKEFTAEVSRDDLQDAVSPVHKSPPLPPTAAPVGSPASPQPGRQAPAVPPAAKPVAKRARGQSIAQVKPGAKDPAKGRSQSVGRKRATTIRGGSGPPPLAQLAGAAAGSPGSASPQSASSPGAAATSPGAPLHASAAGAGAASPGASGGTAQVGAFPVSPAAGAAARAAAAAGAAAAAAAALLAAAAFDEPGAATPAMTGGGAAGSSSNATEWRGPRGKVEGRSRRKLNWSAGDDAATEASAKSEPLAPGSQALLGAADAVLMTSEECGPESGLAAPRLPVARREKSERSRRKLNWTAEDSPSPPDASPHSAASRGSVGSRRSEDPDPAAGTEGTPSVSPLPPCSLRQRSLAQSEHSLAPSDRSGEGMTPPFSWAGPKRNSDDEGSPARGGSVALPPSRRADGKRDGQSDGAPAAADPAESVPLADLPAAPAPAAAEGDDPPIQRRRTLAQRTKSTLAVSTEAEPDTAEGLEVDDFGVVQESPKSPRSPTKAKALNMPFSPRSRGKRAEGTIPAALVPLVKAAAGGGLAAPEASFPRQGSGLLARSASGFGRRHSSFSARPDELSREALMAQAHDEDCILRWFNKAIELCGIPEATRHCVPSFMVGHRLLEPYMLVMHYMSPGDVNVSMVMRVLDAETDTKKAELVLEAAEKLDMAFPLTARELVNPLAVEQHVLIATALFQRFSDPHLSAACGMRPLKPPPGTNPTVSPLWVGGGPETARQWRARMTDAWQRSMRWRGAGAAAQSLATEALLSKVQGRAVKGMSAAEKAQLKIYTQDAIAQSEDLLPEDPVARQRAVGVLNQVLTAHYRQLRKIYLYYSTGDHLDVELSLEETVKMMQEAKVLGPKSNTGISRTAFDSYFHRLTGQRGAQMGPSQFVALLVRLASDMKKGWMSHGKQVGLGRRLQGLITDLLIPNCHYADLSEFQSALYGDACSDVLDRYQEWLLGVFRAFSTVQRGDTKYMSIKDFGGLVQEMNLIDASLSHEQVRTVFVKMQDIENDVTVGIVRGEHNLIYREYVECMAALAMYKTPAPYLPFCRKVHRFLEQWFVPTFSEGKHWRVRSEIARIKQEGVG
eukprot:TRINITY_DN16559_c0_g4_i1.p1 TRINITY_DN16559_c0_g4~~TRINITY_DN16559_c0_g4_i1.p1  ORF type:complete len:1562 (+),score=477.32 TRINITY_DN16559_c0_g4_i1:593-4687(+)